MRFLDGVRVGVGSRGPRLAGLLIVVLAAAACGSDGPSRVATNQPIVHDSSVTDAEAESAVAAALRDDRVRMSDDHRVVGVGRVGPEGFGEVFIRVVLRGDVEKGPPDVCAIGGHSGSVTGLVFLVSDPPETVEALSPEWDEKVSCLGDTS